MMLRELLVCAIRSTRHCRWPSVLSRSIHTTTLQRNEITVTPAQTTGYQHVPVMLSQVLERLEPTDGQVYCDATFGAGGYTRAILEAAQCQVLAIDRDPYSIARARDMSAQQFGSRLVPIHGRFRDVASLVQQHTGQSTSCLDGIVFDIGVSSMQIDDSTRGFSYRFDGPLDMRMNNQDEHVTAADIVNSLDATHLTHLFKTLGEEKYARQIAHAIEQARLTAPIMSTEQLANIVLDTVKRRTPDPYRSVARIFQSLRIKVNDELEELRLGLLAAERLLKPGGRLVVVTFHSLEDRIVKDFLYRCNGRRRLEGKEDARAQRKQGRLLKEQALKRTETMLEDDVAWSTYLNEVPSSPIINATSLPAPSFTLTERRSIRPLPDEISRNSRAASAKLRAAIRTDAPPLAPFIRLP